MSSRVRVSIVIPAYNEERHLGACLDAIAAQTAPVFEVIVVDNNSTDKTAEVAARYPFVTVVRERRQGRVFARNAGFNAARGDIIGRVDADVIIPEYWVEHIQDFYTDERHAHLAWTGRGFFPNMRLPHISSFVYRFLSFELNKALLGFYTMWGSNMALPRAQWQAVAGTVCLRNDIHEDLDLAMHLVQDGGYGIYFDRKTVVQAVVRLPGFTDGNELWERLQWWPRAARLHGYAAWMLIWLVGAVLLYCLLPLPVLFDRFARWFGRPTLAERGVPLPGGMHIEGREKAARAEEP